MTYTLADAVRLEFERSHPHGKNTLFCEQCRRRLDREDFRETPWHGRAARCQRCEGHTWAELRHEHTLWELGQAREKLHAYQRYAAFLKYAHVPRRYVLAWGLTDPVTSLPEERPRPKRQRLTGKRATR
ncbi:hypothetical protein [Streptomyces sp. NPDC059753]|uniref:hypothetical protein n=1 Tax=Streptomyces sp. NPDC059753 TaxID=3346933 RepID=UPI00366216F3